MLISVHVTVTRFRWDTVPVVHNLYKTQMNEWRLIHGNNEVSTTIFEYTGNSNCTCDTITISVSVVSS